MTAASAAASSQKSTLLLDLWYRILGFVAKWAEAGSRGQAMNMVLWMVPLVMIAVGFGATSAVLQLLFSNPRQWLLSLPFVPLLPIGMVLLAAYLTVSVKGHLIFRPARLEAIAPLSRQGLSHPPGILDVAVTGNFWREQKRWTCFIAIPCNFGRQQTGEFVFFRELDASTYVYGLRMFDERGLWVLTLTPGQYWFLDTGLQYWGRTKRPAVRIRYRFPKGQASTVWVCAGTVEELQQLLSALTPYAAPPPIPKEEIGL